MVKKEVSEIKKLYTAKNCSITRICGCYVDGEKNQKAQFKDAFLSLPEDEIDKYFNILRKTLSGSIGKNLHTLEFPLCAETEDGAQAQLLQLRNSKLKDDSLLDQFYQNIIDSYEYEGNYLILVIHDAYDIPGRTRDGLQMEDASDEVYEYILVSICPVKLSKPGLSYKADQNAFHGRIRDWVVGAPETGFLFPAFNDRCPDIHSILYYSKNAKDLREDFVSDFTGCSLTAPPATQKEIFNELIGRVLGTECQVNTVRDIHLGMMEAVEKHKNDAEPLIFEKNDIREVICEAGVPEDQMQDFDQIYDDLISQDVKLYADNIVNKKAIEVNSTGIQLKIDPAYAHLVSTKEVEGKAILQISLQGDVDISGISAMGVSEK